MRAHSRRVVLGTAALLAASAVTALAPAASAVVTPPGQPTSLAVVPDDQAAYVSWQPPASNGGAPVSSYTVMATDTSVSANAHRSVTLTAPCAQCTTVYFSQLVNNDNYVFTVAAHNSAGTGVPTSPSASARRSTSPSFPTAFR